MAKKLKLVVGEGFEREETIVDTNYRDALIKIKNTITNMRSDQTLRITKVE